MQDITIKVDDLKQYKIDNNSNVKMQSNRKDRRRVESLNRKALKKMLKMGKV